MFALTPWRKEKKAGTLLPVNERFRLMNEVEDLFERLFSTWPFPVEEAELPRHWGIKTEENDKEVLVRVDLPGFEPVELDVRAASELLTIEAKHKVPTEVKEKEVKEYAHVRCVLALPPKVDAENAEATFRNGVLEVRLPKLPEAVGRRIEVKV